MKMKKWTVLKRVASLGMMFTLTAGALIGCGSSTTADNSDGPVTLTIAARGGSHVDVINSVKEKFEKDNNVKIEVLGLEAADLKQKAALDAVNSEGTYDLVMVDDPVMPEYIDGGVLMDLTKYGYNDDQDFVSTSLEVGKDAKTKDTYALPFNGNVQLFFYNNEVLKSLNATVPTSWEGVLDTAKNAKTAGKLGYNIRGQQGNPIVSDYLPIAWAYGADVFDSNWNVTIDSEQSKQALQMYIDLLATGANYEKNDLVSSVSDGKSAMALGWPSWFISSSGASAAYAAVPTKSTESSTTYSTGMIGNWMMGVTNNSKHKDLSVKLLEYLTSEEVQTAAVDNGGVPTRTSVFNNQEVLTKYPYFKTVYEASVNGKVRPRTAKWSKVEEALGIELSNAISGTKSVDTALSDAKKAIEGIMK